MDRFDLEQKILETHDFVDRLNDISYGVIEVGMDYLKWASNLKYSIKDGLLRGDKRTGEHTPQAKAAQKTIELYGWWKNRNNRPNPYDIVTEENDGKNYFFKIDKMEKEYYREDNKMLIDLIKIRNNLWT